MSNTILPLQKALVVDPLVDMATETVFAVEKSSSVQNYYNIASTNRSSSSISWTVNCNSENTITDRVWLLDISATITIPFSAKPADDKSICLRPFALARCANSIVLQQGNSSTSIQSNQIITALERYGFYDKYLNYSESNPDLDMTTPYVAGQGVFAPSSEIIGGKFQSRYASSYIKAVRWAGTTSVAIDVQFQEPVLIPPLLSGLEQRKQGLTRMQQYQLTYNFTNFNRAVSVVYTDGSYVTGAVSVDFGGDCTLSLLQAIPSPLDVGRISGNQTLPYDEFVAFASPDVKLAMSDEDKISGEGKQFVSNVIQVSRIPEAIYIYCRPSDAFLNKTGSPHITDTFARYVENSLSVNFNGLQQFQNTSPLQLYRICRQNSCNIPWAQWNCSGIDNVDYSNTGGILYNSGVGAVICLKLSSNITLDSSLSPSCNSKVNLQVSCSFANPISKIDKANNPYQVDEIPFVMYTLIHYSGLQTAYSANSLQTSIGVLSVEDVVSAVKRNERVHYSVIDNDVYGGASFLDKAKKFLTEGKLMNALKQLKSYFSHPLTKEIGKTAKEYLRGREDAKDGSQVADLIDELGLGMSGGRKMTKAQLKNALLR